MELTTSSSTDTTFEDVDEGNERGLNQRVSSLESDVVGYQETHIPGFPDPAKSPQYYIDRYDTEPAYKKWFDSQFPGYTIQDIVIPSEKIQNVIPVQIKDTARMWASGSLQDSSFAGIIKQLIQNGVIQSESGLQSESATIRPIPDWVKNNGVVVRRPNN